MKKLFLFFLVLLVVQLSLKSQTVTVGDGGTEYLNLKEAFDDINAGNLTGDIILQIIDNCTQNATAVLYPSGYLGNSSYTSITIYPTGGTGFKINGNFNGPLIELNGAANVTFDGRVDQTGVADLIIVNSNTGSAASTIKFTESANHNTINYCYILGSGLGSSSGTIFFSSSTSGSGNDNNLISNNYISNDSGNRPVNSIYSSGSSGYDNSSNTISNNNILDFFNPGVDSYGINLGSFSSTFTISNNSFYESGAFAPTGSTSYYVLYLNNSSGTGFSISGNKIGGSAANCGGAAWTKTNAYNNFFYGMYLSVGTGTATSVQNNTIKNFDWSNSGNASWTGINIAGGDVNAGTTSGNTIGATSGTGSIIVTIGGVSNSDVFGINITSTGTVVCQNNNIGAITPANADATNATNFYGINKSAVSGDVTISSNTIGSTGTANSINANSACTGANAQVVMGINCSGTGTNIISNNTVANLTNGTTNSGTTRRGLINGISATDGTCTISGNVIRDLKIANANNASNYQASICGMALTGISYSKTVQGNTIYNLSNTNSSTSPYCVIGLFHTGTTSATNTIGENFMHSFSVSGSAANIYGIKINSGASTYRNNIISLGGGINTATTIWGIYETGASGNNNNLYFNTVYISGAPTSGSKNSYALQSVVTTNSRDFRNNVFLNARSNNGATGIHYGMYITSAGGALTCDYNDYYAPGTGNSLGYYGGSKSSLPIVTGQDANSFAINPVLTSAGSTTASDYTIGVDMIGSASTGISTDFGSATRNNPTVGAWERVVNKWTGVTSTAWATTSNWSAGVVPLSNSNIIFDTSPAHDCYLAAAYTVNNVINGSTKKLVTNSKQLTIKGSLTLTNGALVDATSASTELVYAGTAAQTIDGANFVSGKTYNLTIDNTFGVAINSDFTVDNALTINSGRSLTVSSGKLLTVTGTLTNSAGNSGLVLKSDATGDAKLINNTSSVPATVELYLDGGAGGSGPKFHYITPPVSTVTIGSTIAQVKTNLGLTNFNGDLLSYSEVAAAGNKDAGWQYFDGFNSTTPFSTLAPSNGYNIYLTGNDKITFTGQLNSAAQTFSSLSYTNQGWNLIGNPYPCNFNLAGVSVLTATDNVDNTVYFNHDGGYGFWNVGLNTGTSGFSSVIAPMQGFMVRVTATGQSVTLPTASKTSSAATPLRSKGYSLLKKMKLVLNNGIVPDETIVCLVDKATSGFDSDYDAFKLFGTGSSAPSIYTEVSSIKYALNSIQEPQTGTTIIPMTVIIKTAGTYKIDVSEFENLEGTNVVLRHGSDQVVLGRDASYTFTSSAGTFTDFQIVIGNTITGVEKTEKSELKVWFSSSYLNIEANDDISSGNSKIAIFDIQGKQVYSNTGIYLTAGQKYQISLDLQKGVYIAHIQGRSKPYISKFVVY